MEVIKSLERKKRQKTLLFVSVGVAVAAVLILYFGFLRKGDVGSEEIVLNPQEGAQQARSSVVEEKLKKINLDFDFLNEKILSFLKIHGDLPVKKGTTGRENPYIPY